MRGRKLTSRFVEAVATKRDREDLRDAAVSGLQLRVTKAGKKSWTFRYRRRSDGRLRRVTLGAYPGITLLEARQIARDYTASVGRGADPANDVRDRKQAETFVEIAAEWMERHANQNKGPRSRRDDRSMLERHVLPNIGALKATEITKRDIIRMLDSVIAAQDARATKAREPAGASGAGDVGAPRRLTHRPNRVFELVRAIFRWAVGRDLLKVDPTWGMKPPIKKEKARERELSPDEIRRLWMALDRAPARRRSTRGEARGAQVAYGNAIPMMKATALALKLALATAQRIGEVAGIAVSELDFDDKAPIWIVPGERSKNGQPNRVPLSPLAVSLIREAMCLAPGSRWLFPNPTGSGPIKPHAPTKAMERARPALGFMDVRVHDLRRTAATRMAEMGISPHTISLVLNHVSARSGTVTSKVYVQYSYDREKREALLAWGSRLADIVTRTKAPSLVALAG